MQIHILQVQDLCLDILQDEKNYWKKIANCSKKFIHKMSFRETAKDFVNKAQGMLKAFTVTYNPDDQSFSVGMNAEALVNAIHRCNQLRLPIMIFGAGLPKILKSLGEIKTYSERLFRFEEIGSLNEKEAEEAIVKPAEPLSVQYEEGAIQKIIEITEGYPYFIQELCSVVWDNLNTDTVVIKECDVDNAVSEFYEKLDRGFYRMRYDRCTQKEKLFMFAMVKCGDLPCTISNVAKIMKRSVNSITN